MIAMIFIWLITLFLLLAIIGGVHNSIQKGFNFPDFFTIVALMFIFVIFATIALTGGFILK